MDKGIPMKTTIIILTVLVLALSSLCLYLWSEVERNADAAEKWAGRCGEADGRIEVLEQAKAELVEMVKLAYLKGVRDGAR